MKCPACANDLTEVKAGTISVDICKNGCGGAWFDWKELKAFDEPHEFASEEILGAGRPGTSVSRDLRYCPKCENEVLCRRFYDIEGQVEVDQCLRCSGIWLDTGELQTIRGQYATEEERIKAADAYLGEQLKTHQQVLHEVQSEEGFTPEERRHFENFEHRSALGRLFQKLFQ